MVSHGKEPGLGDPIFRCGAQAPAARNGHPIRSWPHSLRSPAEVWQPGHSWPSRSTRCRGIKAQGLVIHKPGTWRQPPSACPCPSPGRQTAFSPLPSACSPCSFPTLATDTWFQQQVQGRPGLPCSRLWPRRLHHPWAGASGLQKQGLCLCCSSSCQVHYSGYFLSLSFLFYVK